MQIVTVQVYAGAVRLVAVVLRSVTEISPIVCFCKSFKVTAVSMCHFVQQQKLRHLLRKYTRGVFTVSDIGSH